MTVLDPDAGSLLLKGYLEAHYRGFDYGSHDARDPVSLVRRFRDGDPREIEVAGLLAATLAYGKVQIILSHVADALHRMDDSPLAYVRSFDPERRRGDWTGFCHRFNDERDLRFLLWAIRCALERHGSLESVVADAVGPDDPDLAPGVSALVETLLKTDPRPVFGGRRRSLPGSVRFLLPSPARGSACKRLFMFCRWMVRRPEAFDRVDLGVWRRLSPGQLLLPLDTHIARLIRHLGLVESRRTVDLAMAREATARLREFDPLDPVKYDFALAHLGISSLCRHRLDDRTCGRCGLGPVCRVAAAPPPGPARPLRRRSPTGR
ncbi:MAG: TIGR02757 family protein [Candidatus Riflebacteria bacterium]|nr:TIGR02757 family protein [Candidatus Riflebacteria bacterium]